VITLNRYGLLTEEERLEFVEAVRQSAIEEADDSFIEVDEIRELLHQQEYNDILLEARDAWLSDIDSHVRRLRLEWDSEYAPDDYFDKFRSSVKNFTTALGDNIEQNEIKAKVESSVWSAMLQMYSDYEETPTVTAPLQQSKSKRDSLEELFRDVDD
jgi:hypothetical protein